MLTVDLADMAAFTLMVRNSCRVYCTEHETNNGRRDRGMLEEGAIESECSFQWFFFRCKFESVRADTGKVEE